MTVGLSISRGFGDADRDFCGRGTEDAGRVVVVLLLLVLPRPRGSGVDRWESAGLTGFDVLISRLSGAGQPNSLFS